MMKPSLSQEVGRITRPVWIRLPGKNERCPYTGLSRTTLFELCAPCQANDFHPPIESLVIKKRYAKRGIRLIRYKSLMRYLRDLAAKEKSLTLKIQPGLRARGRAAQHS